MLCNNNNNKQLKHKNTLLIKEFAQENQLGFNKEKQNASYYIIKKGLHVE